MDTTPKRVECQGCGELWLEDELEVRWPDIPDISERCAPGEPIPVGECNACGALCHYADTTWVTIHKSGPSNPEQDIADGLALLRAWDAEQLVIWRYRPDIDLQSVLTVGSTAGAKACAAAVGNKFKTTMCWPDNMTQAWPNALSAETPQADTLEWLAIQLLKLHYQHGVPSTADIVLQVGYDSRDNPCYRVLGELTAVVDEQGQPVIVLLPSTDEVLIEGPLT